MRLTILSIVAIVFLLCLALVSSQYKIANVDYTLEDVADSIAKTLEEGDPDRPLVTGNLYNSKNDSSKGFVESSYKVEEGGKGDNPDDEKTGMAQETYELTKIAVDVKESDKEIYPDEYGAAVKEKTAIKGKKILENAFPDDTQTWDKATPNLFKLSGKGEHIPGVSVKPKEILVVGSKIRLELKELYETTDGKHGKWSDIDSYVSIETQEELASFAVAIALNDRNVEEIAINYGKIKMSYSQPAKLFGFINVDYTAEAIVDKEGRVKVKFPFWTKISKTNKKKLEQELKAISDDAQLANIDLQNSLQKQQQVIQMLSNIMKVNHDTAMAVIRKIG